MSVKVANVALTDTFDTWRIRSNQGFTNLFAIFILIRIWTVLK